MKTVFKKNITSTFLICSLGLSICSPPVLAQANTPQEILQKSSKQNWQDTIKSQLKLAQAKLSLLKAQNELWFTKNKVTTQQLLDESLKNLEHAWKTSDSITRAQIKDLTQRIDQTKKLLAKKNTNVISEMDSLVNHSQSILNTVLAQTQEKSRDYKNEVSTHYALLIAKGAELKAIIALEIDKSPENAYQEIIKAEHAYQQASEAANETLSKEILKLKLKMADVKSSINERSNTSKDQIESLISATETHIDSYKKTIEQSSEANLFKNRYAQIEAQSALLKAKLALYSNEANGIVLSYLEESKGWYNSVRSESSAQWEDELSSMSAHIDEAKDFVHRKDVQARTKISTLLEQAALIIKKEDSIK
ncbi:MAG: hypothetical protein JKX67_08105 [Colwellia sp.]|nr:hypothetical protein [Colwellia sp.]